MVKPVYSITPFTLLDYPKKTACVLWYAGCNMKCLYCYNPEIVFGKGKLYFSEVVSFLKTRKGLLDAVVFSGGECLIHKDIIEQIYTVKSMGFLVKVDTNGSKPKVLEELLQNKFLDYVSLDFKSGRKSFQDITQSNLFDQFEKSLHLLLKENISFEVRTTYHSELFSNQDIEDMITYLKENQYTGCYYIQFFKNDVKTIAQLPYSHNCLKGFLDSEKLKIVFR